MSFRRFWITAIACLSLGGCNTVYTHIADEDPGLGEAPKYDAAIQTINPAPVYGPSSAQPGSNGDVGAHAVKRYRTGAVTAIQSLGTSGSSGSSGGGSGMTTGGGPQ